MLKISATQKIGFKHVRSIVELMDFRFNGESIPITAINNQKKLALGATVAFLIENDKISKFVVAVCSGAEKNFDKYRGKKEALAKLLEYTIFNREARKLIWQKYFEAFGLPH